MMASDLPIILYGYEGSVWTTKLRYYLDLRGIKYSLCIQPNRLPRPDLEELGIKYRRIPLMAIGRDVYCDSRLIFRKLEELFPKGALGSKIPEIRGIEYLLDNWTGDGGPFWRAAGTLPSTHPMIREKEWIEDRKEMTGCRFNPDTMDQTRPESQAHIRMYLDMLETTWLADEREWILGKEGPSLADIHAVFVFEWVFHDPRMEGAVPESVASEVTHLKAFARIHRFRTSWLSARLPDDQSLETISSEHAISTILSSGWAEDGGKVDETDALGLKEGQEVEVWPLDSGMNHRDRGSLGKLSTNEVMILIQSRSGKELRLHFPRHNFRVYAVRR